MGDVLPPVVTKTVKPKWRTNSKIFTTTTIGVVVPKTFCALLRKIVQEIDLAKNSGKATFVDMAMSYTGSLLHTEYRKALFKHHQYTSSHFVECLSGLSSDDMTNFLLLKIPGVKALHITDRTITSGSWRLVTTNDPYVAARIDDYLHKHYTTHPFEIPPNRSRKASKSVTEATKQAWITQTKHFTVTAPPQKNTWIQSLKLTRPKTVVKSDDRSTSMLNTTSSKRDNLDEISRLIRALQESNNANKKMREDFSRSLQTQTTLQGEVLQLKRAKPTPISNTDSIFSKLQSKLDS